MQLLDQIVDPLLHGIKLTGIFLTPGFGLGFVHKGGDVNHLRTLQTAQNKALLPGIGTEHQGEQLRIRIGNGGMEGYGIITVFRLWNNGFDDGKNETVFNLLKQNIPGEWAENTRGIRIRNKIHLEWGERFEWPDCNAQIKGTRFSCYGLRDQFGILSDGTVVPCCLDSDGIINLGNIFDENIDSILNSERALNIINGFKNGTASEDLCKRCGYAQKFI